MRIPTTSLALGLVGAFIGSSATWAQEPPPSRQPVPPPSPQLEAAAPDGPAPRLELSSSEWDFGMKWFGEPASGEVTIGNAGDAPLKIIKVRTSCGCTLAQPGSGGSWTGKVLQPGETDTMTLKYNTKKNRRDVSQTVTIESNDPQQPRAIIRVKGEVRKVYEAKPDRITFGNIEPEESATATIELRNNMDEEVFLKLKPLNQEVPFEIKLEEVEPGKVYRLSATTKPPLKIGSTTIEDGIQLETGLEKHPEISIPASIYIAPRVSVSPRRLFVSPRVTKPFQRLVRVNYRASKPVKVTEIKSSHPELIRAEILDPAAQLARPRPNRPTLFHQIRVYLPAGPDFPEGGAQLEIFTDDPSPEYQKLVVDIQPRPVSPQTMRPPRGRRMGPPAPVVGSSEGQDSENPDEAESNEPGGANNEEEDGEEEPE